MNRREFSPRDYRQLNDLLDGRLSDKQQAAFQTRLEQSTELQRQVLEQKRLRASLRALPHIKSPRNFTLTPAMVKVRRARLKLANGFSLASAGVAILLMLAFAGEFVLGSAFPIMAKSAPEAPMTAMLEMSAQDEESQEPVIIFWNAPALGGAGGSGMEAGAFGMGGGGVYDDASPISAGIEPQPEMEPVLEIAEAPVESDSIRKNDGNLPSETVILGLRLDDEAQLSYTMRAQLLWQKSAQWLAGISPLRWLQVSLAILLLGFGVTAITLRKRKPC